MIVPLAKLGAIFLPGYYAHERKARQRETFKHVPADRLLIETDAPDQLPRPHSSGIRSPTPPEVIHHPAILKSNVAWRLRKANRNVGRQVKLNACLVAGRAEQARQLNNMITVDEPTKAPSHLSHVILSPN
jgi:Tat protein secretion system quality control protein TatD with DNase activity